MSARQTPPLVSKIITYKTTLKVSSSSKDLDATDLHLRPAGYQQNLFARRVVVSCRVRPALEVTGGKRLLTEKQAKKYNPK